MKLSTTKTKPQETQVDVLGVFVFSEKQAVKKAADFLPSSLRKEYLAQVERVKFKGKHNKSVSLFTHRKIPAFLVQFVGLGGANKKKEILLDRVREASAQVCNVARQYRGKKVGILLPSDIAVYLTKHDIGEAIAEGAILGSYEYTKHKTKKKDGKIEEVVVFGEDRDIKKGLQKGAIECEGVVLTRDLVNEPAGHMKPKELVAVARDVAKNSAVEVKVFNRLQLKKMRCGGILGVSQGSTSEPYLIHLTYRPKNTKNVKKIAVVGKGITFDSGGLSIKPAQYMETMKIDMAGAAAVLGLFSVLPKLQPKAEVHGFIATCENLVSGDALRPGDVVTIRNGKTVEILNTDAEGRLILADAISYAVEHKPDVIIDIATLTGACIVALGENIAGLMTNNKDLQEALLKAGEHAGEKIWTLPLEESYKETLKSDIADLRNVSTMQTGGAITAALFLQEFIGKIPWAHLDIAGPVWNDKKVNAYTGKGASGFGVRTLVHYLENIS